VVARAQAALRALAGRPAWEVPAAGRAPAAVAEPGAQEAKQVAAAMVEREELRAKEAPAA
jgi:hypothetical protein